MVKDIIENTHIISSKVTKFIWLLGYNNFSKIDMYFETKGVINIFQWLKPKLDHLHKPKNIYNMKF